MVTGSNPATTKLNNLRVSGLRTMCTRTMDSFSRVILEQNLLHDEQPPRGLSKASRTSVRLFSSTLFCRSFSLTPPKPNPAPPPLLSPSGGLVSKLLKIKQRPDFCLLAENVSRFTQNRPTCVWHCCLRLYKFRFSNQGATKNRAYC